MQTTDSPILASLCRAIVENSINCTAPSVLLSLLQVAISEQTYTDWSDHKSDRLCDGDHFRKPRLRTHISSRIVAYYTWLIIRSLLYATKAMIRASTMNTDYRKEHEYS